MMEAELWTNIYVMTDDNDRCDMYSVNIYLYKWNYNNLIQFLWHYYKFQLQHFHTEDTEMKDLVNSKINQSL
jgi:hypothetical protein